MNAEPGAARLLEAAPSALQQYLRAVLPSSVPFVSSKSAGEEAAALRLQGLVPQRAHVAEYGDVVGGWSGDRLPLMYPHLLGFPLQMELMTAAAFPFPVLGLVHVTNEVRALRPLPLGLALDVEVRVGALAEHSRGRTVDLLTEVQADGEVVWTETSTYLHRESGPSSDPAKKTSAKDKPEADEPTALHPSARWHLAGNLGRRYAAVSGDRNPIHLSPWTAKAFGFPRAIAHGMWTAAAVAAALDNRLPESPVYSVQFRKPILLPSTVRLFTAVDGGSVRAEVRGKEGRDTVHMVASAHGADGSPVST